MEVDVSEKPMVQTKITGLLNEICKGLYEREEAVKLAILSAIAGESIFLLGPPGVGKSLIARRLKFAFKDGKSFEYLMSKFSTPDEIFGPVSIKKLKEDDTYERLTDRYLPGANIVFLDEIWKAGPAIQNALLTILNEKIYKNGSQDLKVDIRGIITASNELPPKDSNLSPIWDRFLVRLELENIKKFSSFLDMIVDVKDVYEDDVTEDLKLSNALLDEWTKLIDQVEVPAEVLNTIQVLKLKLTEYNAKTPLEPIVVHDRRWKKVIRLMRTSAFLNGRQAVNLMDCFLMLHCLWGHPSQKEKLSELLVDAVRQHGYTMAVNLQMIKKEVAEFESDVEKETKVKHVVSEVELMPIDDEYFRLEKESNKIEGVYIKINQYRQLKMEDKEVINLYDGEKNLVNRLNAQKSAETNSVDIFHDAIRNTYPLKTRMVNKSQIINKKPHEIVQKHWDERFQKITSFIDQQLAKMSVDAPAETVGLANNLFVDEKYAEVVLSNFEEVRTALKQMKLQLEKIQYAYTNI